MFKGDQYTNIHSKLNRQLEGTDMLANEFKQLLQNFSLSNVLKQPTHFSTSRGTCIDLITTNVVENIESVNVLTPFCSTHFPVGAYLHFKTFIQKIRKKLCKCKLHTTAQRLIRY